MIRGAVVNAICLAILLPVAGYAQQCEQGEELRAAEADRDALLALMLQEVDDHRYESCRKGTICNAHLGEFEQQIDQIDVEITELCDSYSRWRDGLDGLISPSEQPEGTLWQYRDDESRRALHERLVAARIAASKPNQTPPDVVLTMGAPGSGKSTVLQAIGLCQSGVVLVDPDDFKRDLVEYQLGIAAHDRLSADRVHRESSMLAKATRDRAMEISRDLCIDGVMSKRESAIELITRLRDSGYNITIVSVTVPLEVSIQRVQSRGQVTGRFVPREYIELAFENIGQHREELLRLADRGLLYDANVAIDEAPPLLAEYVNGEQRQLQEH